MNTQPYECAIVRYLHDPIAGECLNVGVLLLCASAERRFLDARFEFKYARLSEAFAGFDGEHYRQFLYRIELELRRLSERLNQTLLFQREIPTLTVLLGDLLPDSDMSFQWHIGLAGVTPDPALELEHLFARFVTSQYEKDKNSNRDDEAVWNIFRQPLQSYRVLDRLVPKTFIADEFEYTFPRAFKNKKWHVLQSASFDYVRPETLKDKATNYLGIGSALSDNPEMGKLYLLLGRPTRDSYMRQYERAKRLLAEHLQVEHELVEEEDAERLAASVAKFMSEHPQQ